MTRDRVSALNTNDIIGVKHAGFAGGWPPSLRIDVWRRARVLGINGGALLVQFSDNGERLWLHEQQVSAAKVASEIQEWR